ncbi:MAG: hypothetical protein KDK08_16850 [Rhizobiaceae bacterium]|nr:hypothetical protein [Rhizobiaceae bacterium]
MVRVTVVEMLSDLSYQVLKAVDARSALKVIARRENGFWISRCCLPLATPNIRSFMAGG